MKPENIAAISVAVIVSAFIGFYPIDNAYEIAAILVMIGGLVAALLGKDRDR